MGRRYVYTVYGPRTELRVVLRVGGPSVDLVGEALCALVASLAGTYVASSAETLRDLNVLLPAYDVHAVRRVVIRTDPRLRHVRLGHHIGPVQHCVPVKICTHDDVTCRFLVPIARAATTVAADVSHDFRALVVFLLARGMRCTSHSFADNEPA